ncbi:MAG: hypothetical protein QOH89_3683 [Pseudonocardiales bacterium]|jgi:antibiotic biosynthesis monooxygenase (ABM) superfamily enzyme|nr:hypothetical protein [Pseudonocardiales bacterium]
MKTEPGSESGPPSKHQLAVMIWLAVFPTLTILNLALGDWLGSLTTVLRTLVLSTVAVPIVIYGLMPQLHKLRLWVLLRARGKYSATRRPPEIAGAGVRVVNPL